MSFWSTLKQALSKDLKYAVTHPATIRKEILAVATTVASDLTAFNTVIHLSGPLQTAVTGTTAVATFIVTFLGNNETKP